MVISTDLVHLAQQQMARALAEDNPAARHYWQTAEGMAQAAASLDEAPTTVTLHRITIDALHEQAARHRSDATRVDTWSHASAVAARALPTVRGSIQAWRNAVMNVIHSWAIAEDEDRWIADLPACDQPCRAGDEWAQIGHRTDCRRGRAWRARYKLDHSVGVWPREGQGQ